MNTNTPHCAGCRHDDAPFTDTEKAMLGLISFTLHPRALTELTTLMDEHDSMVVAAFALYYERVDFAGASLIEQFDRTFIDAFETRTECARFIVDYVYRRDRWIRRREQKMGRPFADLLAAGDVTVLRELRNLGLQVIDSGEKIAVYRCSRQ